MSGQFRDDQNVSIESTDNEALARQHGLTEFDPATGQWSRPATSDVGQRDSGQLNEALRENARLSDELAEAHAEIERLRAERQGGGEGDGGAETPPGFTPAEQPQDGDAAPAGRGRKTTGK